MVAKMVQNGRQSFEGLSSKVYPTPPLGLSPSQLPLKGTPTTFKVLRTLSGIYIYIYIPVVTRGTGKRRKER